jgi:hypothetical protein
MEAEVHEQVFSLADPKFDDKLREFCDKATVKVQAQGGSGVIAMRRVEGDKLTCVIIPTGTPVEQVRIADHRQRGFEVADRTAIQHHPAPQTSTSELLRRVQEAQKRKGITGGLDPGDAS